MTQYVTIVLQLKCRGGKLHVIIASTEKVFCDLYLYTILITSCTLNFTLKFSFLYRNDLNKNLFWNMKLKVYFSLKKVRNLNNDTKKLFLNCVLKQNLVKVCKKKYFQKR